KTRRARGRSAGPPALPLVVHIGSVAGPCFASGRDGPRSDPSPSAPQPPLRDAQARSVGSSRNDERSVKHLGVCSGRWRDGAARRAVWGSRAGTSRPGARRRRPTELIWTTSGKAGGPAREPHTARDSETCRAPLRENDDEALLLAHVLQQA